MKAKFLTDLGISEETAQLIISESDSEMKSVREQVSELENQLKDADNNFIFSLNHS